MEEFSEILTENGYQDLNVNFEVKKNYVVLRGKNNSGIAKVDKKEVMIDYDLISIRLGAKLKIEKQPQIENAKTKLSDTFTCLFFDPSAPEIPGILVDRESSIVIGKCFSILDS